MALQSRFTKRLVNNEIISTQIRNFSKFDAFGKSPIPANKAGFLPASGAYPKGFLAGSINVGMKPDSKSQPDVILVASEKPSCGAAVFTKNEFPAASVIVSRDILQKIKGNGVRGVIANSWIANWLTGQEGLEVSLAMSKEANKFISGNTGEYESSMMVVHTGMGGQRLPIKEIIQNIPQLYHSMGKSHFHWLEAAMGICTSDTSPKLASRTFNLPSSPETTFSIAGITKGAGMIHPNVATTLGIICTDAPVTPAALQQLLSTATEKSYNCISIEGDTSTNDMVVMLANGAAASQSDNFVAFQRMLIEFMADMARLVVRDGEGATKFITIRVRGLTSYPAGRHIASAIACSGGIVATLGVLLIGTEFAGKGLIVPDSTPVSFVPNDGGPELKFLEKGVLLKVNDVMARELMEQEDIEVVLNLRDGQENSEEKIEEPLIGPVI